MSELILDETSAKRLIQILEHSLRYHTEFDWSQFDYTPEIIVDALEFLRTSVATMRTFHCLNQLISGTSGSQKISIPITENDLNFITTVGKHYEQAIRDPAKGYTID